MTEIQVTIPGITAGKARSRGLKLLLVGFLAFLIWIPAIMIFALTWERSERASSVQREIHNLRGGEQVVSGPYLLVPANFHKEVTDADGVKHIRTKQRTLAFLPDKVDMRVHLDASERNRSIYSATIYDATLAIEGRFGPLQLPQTEDEIELIWEAAVFAAGLKDTHALKGIKGAPTLIVDGTLQSKPAAPGVTLSVDRNGQAATEVLSGFSVPLDDTSRLAEGFSFELEAQISGGGSFSLASLGKTTKVQATSNWAHPSFQGSHIPEHWSGDEAGFTADWSISGFSRNLPPALIVDNRLTISPRNNSSGLASPPLETHIRKLIAP